MNCKLRKTLFVLLVGVFLFAGSMLVFRLIDAHRNTERQELAESLADIPPESVPAAQTPPTAPTTSTTPTDPIPGETGTPTEEDPLDENVLRLQNWNLASLQTVNPDVIGWILLPGTQINHPLLHTTDNSTYLHTAWDGSYSTSGSIFLETRSNPDFKDFNTIIYGHHMRNGSMFAPLMEYKNAEFLESHPYIYIATEDGIRKYTVFAAYEASVTSDTYRLVFRNTAQKQTALDSYLERSVWDSPITPTVSDRILTLSTCTGTGRYETRWVVQAILTGFWVNEKAGSPQRTSF